MAAFPLIDAHVHLWHPDRFRLSWVDGEELLNRPYTLDLYRDQSKGWPIEGVVFVECGVEPQYAFLEARWAVARAQADPLLKGIVAAAPLEFGTRVSAYLEALLELGPQIKGVRRNLQDESENDFCLRTEFVQGIRLLARHRLSFDLCIRHWQLPAVTELARRCPDTQFILDHLGKPDVRAHQLDPWREQLRQLAGLPNVACKISGLVTEADHATWQPEELAAYLECALEAFGPERVLFGGDWPVVLLASTYERWLQTLQRFTTSLSETEQRKLWRENARRIYRLD